MTGKGNDSETTGAQHQAAVTRWQPLGTGTCKTAGIQGQVEIRDQLRMGFSPALDADLHHSHKQAFPREE